MMIRRFAATVVGLLMAGTSPAAFAQDVAPVASASSPASNEGLGEIIVTANRFEETAQKTPLIISVINSDDLKGVSDIRQMESLSPGVQVTSSGGLLQTYIRGVGQNTVLNGQESAIAYNVDGVFLYTGSMITPLMYDLERIEVLKGPQGTLYGRNASGGAVNLITVGAKLNQTEGYVEGEYGNFDRWRGTAAINLPLGNTLAVRLAGQHLEHDGYLSDGSEDQDITAGRIRLRWEPSSDVTLLIGGDVSHQGGHAFGASIEPNPTDDKWVGGMDPRVNTGASAVFTLPPFKPTFLKNNQWSANAQLDVNLGFATLTLLPAYRHENARYLDYTPGFEEYQISLTREKTIEARLSNRSDVLKWVLGAYYIKNSQRSTSEIRQELLGLHSKPDMKFRLSSYAFFGEATFSVADDIRLIGGLRYTHEKTTLRGINNSVLPPATDAYNPFDPVTNPTGDFSDYPVNGSASANAVTWKAGAEFDLSPTSLIFATASRGFKGGGTFANNPGLENSFKPEYLTAFELGSRNRFLDNRLQLNAELFYWKLKDQQLNFLGLNGAGVPALMTVNPGKAHMYGASADMVWKLTPNDTLRGGVEYTKSKYDSFVRTIAVLSILSTTACEVGPPTPNALPPFLWPVQVDCSGQQVLRAPKWAGSAGYSHRFDLGDSGSVTFNGDMTFNSSRWLSLDYTTLSHQPGYALFNADLTYETANKAVTVTGWIRNIANRRVITNTVQFIDANLRAQLLPPRTFGISARYSF